MFVRMILSLVAVASLTACSTSQIRTPARLEEQRKERELRMNANLVNAAVAYDRAVQSLAVGEFDEARRRVEESLRLNAGFAKAQLLLGRIELEANEPRRALAALADIGPQSAPAFLAQAAYYRGAAQQALLNPRGAEAAFREAVTLDATVDAYALALAETLIDLQQPDAARAILTRRDVVASAELSGCLGFLEMSAGRYGEASAHFRRAQGLAPAGVYAELLGFCLLQTGDYEGAAQALAAAPKDAGASVTLARANALIELRREREALDMLALVEQRGAATPQVLARIGELSLHLGDLTRAAGAADRLVAGWPEVAEGYLIKAVVLARRGARESAEAMAAEGRRRERVLGSA